MWEVNDIQALILGMMGRCYYRAVETVSGDHGCFTEQCTTGDATQSKSSIHPSYQIKIRITQITVVRDSCSNGYGSVLYFVAEWDSMVYDVMPHHDTETETNQSPPYCHNKEETHVSYNMHIYIYIYRFIIWLDVIHTFPLTHFNHVHLFPPTFILNVHPVPSSSNN